MTKYVALAFGALSLLAVSLPAKAGQCYQTCNRIGNQTYCHTNCY